MTVLVPNNIAGLFVPRHLAHGVTDGRPGIAGSFLSTLRRLAEQLAAASLPPAPRQRRPWWPLPGDPSSTTLPASSQRSPTIPGPSARSPPRTGNLRDLSRAALDVISSSSPLRAGLIDLHRTATARIARTW